MDSSRANRPSSATVEFRGEIVVASRIVDYLSSGLYESPAASIKELVNNSFDADARRVDIYIKPDANIIAIEDNGDGMDRAEFEKHFRRISESHKRAESDRTASGRPMIGKIGIGFIAANELCDVMEILSTKRGSRELLQVAIRFDLMRQDVDARRRSDTEYAKADYVGTVGEADRDAHFTQVILKNIRGEAREILAGAGHSRYGAGSRTLYGLRSESIARILADPELKSWTDFDAYSINMLRIALNVPVPYHANWMPPQLRSRVQDIEEHVQRLQFSVAMDGSELRKPIVFPPHEPALVSRFRLDGQHTSAEGYFYAQHGGIKPQELQGLLIRIRNAAVGDYDPTFLGFSPSVGPLFQTWISGEITADDRLEDAMNIDRRTLRITHPAYIELQQAVHEHVAGLIKQVRDEIYGSGSEVRQRERARKLEANIESIALAHISPISRRAATQVQRAWNKASISVTRRRALLRTFTVDKLYRLVVEVAKEVLSREQFERFIAALTRRIQE